MISPPYYLHIDAHFGIDTPTPNTKDVIGLENKLQPNERYIETTVIPNKRQAAKHVSWTLADKVFLQNMAWCLLECAHLCAWVAVSHQLWPQVQSTAVCLFGVHPSSQLQYNAARSQGQPTSKIYSLYFYFLNLPLLLPNPFLFLLLRLSLPFCFSPPPMKALLLPKTCHPQHWWRQVFLVRLPHKHKQLLTHRFAHAHKHAHKNR